MRQVSVHLGVMLMLECLQRTQISADLVCVLLGEKKTAEYMAGLWIMHIERVGPEHVSAIITDGAAVIPKAAELVNAR
jgi:hypothetical protein